MSAMRLWGVLSLVGLAAGCARSLDDLAPFPCATDGTCPASYVCLPRKGCVPDTDVARYTPFPCLADGSCPGAVGLACVPGTGCVASSELAALSPFPCNEDSSCAGDGAFACLAGTGCVAVADLASKVPFACSADGTCPGSLRCLSRQCWPDAPCSLLDQSCTDATRTRCAPVITGSGVEAQCVPPLGSVAEGHACHRDPALVQNFGRDDCDNGLLCASFVGPNHDMLNSGAECLRLCTANDGCGAGARCARVADGVGVCVASCALGDACPGGGACRWVEELAGGGVLGTCQAVTVSPKAAGAPCGGNECAADSTCLGLGGEATCKVQCDATHPCSAGGCQPLQGLDGGGGVCG